MVPPLPTRQLNDAAVFIGIKNQNNIKLALLLDKTTLVIQMKPFYWCNLKNSKLCSKISSDIPDHNHTQGISAPDSDLT